MAVAGVAGVGGDPAGGDLQGGEQGGGAVALVVRVRRSGSPGRSGSTARPGPAPGSGTSRTLTTTALSAAPGTGPRHRGSWLQAPVGAEYERLDPARLDAPPPDPGHLANEMPSSAARNRADQCAIPSRCGGLPSLASVATTTSASSICAGRPAARLIFQRLDPAPRYRSRQPITVGRDTPILRAISAFGIPSRPAAPSGPAWPGPTARSAAAPDPPAAAGHPHAAAAQEQKTCSIVPLKPIVNDFQHATLAAQTTRIIALTALTALGLSGAPVHEAVHGRSPLFRCPATERNITVLQ